MRSSLPANLTVSGAASRLEGPLLFLRQRKHVLKPPGHFPGQDKFSNIMQQGRHYCRIRHVPG